MLLPGLRPEGNNMSEDEAAVSALVRSAVPRDFEGLKNLLVAEQDRLPKRLRQAAAFAVDHPDEMAFGSAASIAERADVQPSTLVRLAQTIGYSGFSDLQNVFRSRLRDRWPDYADRVQAINTSTVQASHPVNLLSGFVDSAQTSLTRLKETISDETLTEAVKVLAQAETIYLLGQRRAFPVTAYLAYALGKLDVRVVLVDNLASLGPEQTRFASPKDALLAISFKPYTSITIELAQEMAARNVPVIAITDSAFSPLTSAANLWFEVLESDFGAFRSIAATFSLAMAIAVAVAERRSKKRKKND